MRVHRSLDRLPAAERGRVVAIGNFDGVHRGHQTVLAAAMMHARTLGTRPAVLTFEPHPREVLTPDRAPPRLTTLRGKALLLRELGIDRVCLLRFDANVAALSPETFVERLLVRGMGVRHVVIGDDFRFGHKRMGDVGVLEALGKAHGFGVTALPPHLEDGVLCSSSRIRQALADGEIDLATRLLGHPHHVEGLVVKGDGRGRDLGYPTANLRTSRVLLPADGVYAVRAGLVEEGRLVWLDGAANLGTSPTFAGGLRRLEVHLFDLERDLYGRRLCVAFVARLREERRYGEVAELVAQMARDCEDARRILGGPLPA